MSAGDEFHFCEAKSFVSPTGLVRTMPRSCLKWWRVTDACLYYHFFQARLRLERPTNDFSIWLKKLGAPKLAQAVDRLNPYGRHALRAQGTDFEIGRGCAPDMAVTIQDYEEPPERRLSKN